MSQRRHYTVPQVARIIDVSSNTVRKMIDTGQIIGHRIPGTRRRRVTREALADFLRQHPELGDPEHLADLSL